MLPWPDFSRCGISCSQPRTDLEALPPVLLGVHAAAGADVRHEDVATAELGDRAVEPGLVGLGVAHVDGAARDRHPARLEVAHGIRHLVLAARAQADVTALRGQQVDDGASDALGGAGDDGAFAAKSEIHRSFPESGAEDVKGAGLLDDEAVVEQQLGAIDVA
jgi:hypothetical protein